VRNAVPTRKNTTKRPVRHRALCRRPEIERSAADLKSGQDIFTLRGIDRTAGCLVIVRPDQYVAQVLPLDGYEELAAFFDGFMMPI
jgi:hypothetical protein